MSKERSAILSQSPIFEELPREVLEAIAETVRPLVLPAKSLIFHEGDFGDRLYIIESGSVRIFRKNDSGIDIDLSIKGPGETFGEVALLTGEARTADVETLNETALMVLTKNDFDRLMQTYPDIHKVFIKEMRKWLVKDASRLDAYATQAYQSLRMRWTDFFLIILVSLILAGIFNYSNPNGIPLFPEFPDRKAFPSLSPAALKAESRTRDILILDAGPANFFQKSHIPGAVNMPLDIFDIVYLMTFPEKNKEKRIVIYGGTISRLYGLELAQKLALRGHENIRLLEGGLPAWKKMGYPVEAKAKL